MAGGLIQLLAWGNQNVYLNGNPSITFFKKTFKTHTNFSMESIRINLNRSEANVNETTLFKAKIDRHGDMVQQIYFVFELPDITSPADLAFCWVENIGEAIINSYQISIGGNVVDKQDGEFLHVMNNLSISEEKRKLYDRMIGNVEELTRPAFKDFSVANGANGIFISQYPASTNAANGVSIRGRKVYVPLRFWFNQDSGQALPLISLQYTDAEIAIETRPFRELYKVLDIQDSYPLYVAPLPSNPRHALKEFATSMSSPGNLDIKAYLEVNYIFLDTPERKFLSYNPVQYLIEQTYRVTSLATSINSTINLTLQNPIKEIMWFCRRNNVDLTNDWFDFMDYNSTQILSRAKIMFNGLDRIDFKDAGYYNYIQPWQHHKGCNKDGIYLYSFSLNPDDFQPSGSVNASRINKFQLSLTTKQPFDDTYQYDVVVFAVNYNLLKISSGLAGVAYSS